MSRSSADRPDVLSVAELTRQIKGTLEGSFSSLWIAGEISDLARPSSGHVYFTLKDDRSQIRAVMWRSSVARLKFQLKDGQQVVCQGGLDVYEARGSYQLVVRTMEPQGIGAMQLALQQLHQRLVAEGLFDPARKRPLPPFPRRVGFVTSPSGAALRDFLEVARRRWPGVEIVIIPAVVQGATAPKSICEGIIAGNVYSPTLDVLVVGRGGGSMEDLWCFNDERVVRALAASTVPTVSAVGHEIDVTLADLAADVRALTPSAAAEMILPDADQLAQLLAHMAQRLHRPIEHLLTSYRQRLHWLEQRPVLRRPADRINELARRLDELDQRSQIAITSLLKQRHAQLGQLAASLSALSPLDTLARGYSISFPLGSDQVLRDTASVNLGDQILTRLSKGQLVSEVKEIR